MQSSDTPYCIDKSRIRNFNEEIKDELTCKSCGFIVLVGFCCKDCEGIYCKLCARLSAQEQKCCNTCKKVFEEKAPPRIIMNMISRLRITCKNHEEGCKELLEPDKILAHESGTCAYSKLICTNPLCNQQIFKKDFPSHFCVNNNGFKISNAEKLLGRRSLEFDIDLDSFSNCKLCAGNTLSRSFTHDPLDCLGKAVLELKEQNNAYKQEKLESRNVMLALGEKLKEKESVIQILSENLIHVLKRVEVLEERFEIMERKNKGITNIAMSPALDNSQSQMFFNFSHWAIQFPQRSGNPYPEILLNTYAKVNVGGQVEQITYFLPLNKTLLLLLIDGKRFSCWNTYGDCEVPHYLDVKKDKADVNFTSFSLFSLRGQTVENLFYKELDWEESWALSEYGYLLIIAEDVCSDIYLYDLEFKAEKRCIFFLEKVYLPQEDQPQAASSALRNLNIPMVVEDVGNSTHILSTGVCRQTADTIKIWDCVQTHNTVTIIKMAHTNNIYDVKVIDRGRTFASAGEDCTVKIWEIIHNTFEKIVSVRSKFIISSDQPVKELQFPPQNRKLLILKKRTSFESWSLTSFKKVSQSDNMPFEIGGSLLIEYTGAEREGGEWEIIFTNRQSNIFLVIRNDLTKVSRLLADKNEPNPLDSIFDEGCNYLKLAPVKNKGSDHTIADFIIFSVGRRNTSLNIYTCSMK